VNTRARGSARSSLQKSSVVAPAKSRTSLVEVAVEQALHVRLLVEAAPPAWAAATSPTSIVIVAAMTVMVRLVGVPSGVDVSWTWGGGGSVLVWDAELAGGVVCGVHRMCLPASVVGWRAVRRWVNLAPGVGRPVAVAAAALGRGGPRGDQRSDPPLARCTGRLRVCNVSATGGHDRRSRGSGR
jgi:hypothetical protein